jgi:hypothetical protein
VEKLAEILAVSQPRSLSVAHMQIPCCTGLIRVVQAAMQKAGLQIPLKIYTVTVDGEMETAVV